MQEKKPKGLGRAPVLARVARTLALGLFVAALTLDLTGRAAGIPPLWIVGAHAAELGILAWLPGWWIGPRVARLAWYVTLVAFFLARFLRGTAGVPPDPPLIMLEVLGVGLALRCWFKARSAERRATSYSGNGPASV
ncbi:MAG: hypothetical protein WEE89_11105 [Gemmatimonadota bacterium]